MATKQQVQKISVQPIDPRWDAEELVHTRFSAAPQPPTPIREPRYIHAMMLAEWVGRLFDPVDLVHHH